MLALIVLFCLLSFLDIMQVYAASTWNIQTVDPQGSGGSIALDSNGNPHIAYYIDAAANKTRSGLNYAFWTGAYWNSQTVDSLGSGGTLALDSNNKPHIIYRAQVSTNELKYAHLNGNNWTIQTIDSKGKILDYAAALDSNNNLNLVFSYNRIVNSSYAELDLIYAILIGSNLTSQSIDTGRDYGWFSIAIDNNNIPHISLFDSTNKGGDDANGTLKYATRSNSNGWNIQTIDSTPDAQSSIAVDSKGQPHISYVNYGLKYASWNGNEWSIQTVDENKYVTGPCSFVLDSNDNAHIIYNPGLLLNNNSGVLHVDEIYDLNYAKWAGSTWSIETIDPDGAVGSIAVDSTANPHISFYRVAHGMFNYYNLTYASLIDPTFTSSPSLIPSASSSTPEFSQLLGTAFVLTLILVISLIIIWKKKHKKAN